MPDNNEDVEDSVIQPECPAASSLDADDKDMAKLETFIRDGDEKGAIDFIHRNPGIMGEKDADGNPVWEVTPSPLMLAAWYGKKEVLDCIIQMQAQNDPPLDERLKAWSSAMNKAHFTIARCIMDISPGILDRNIDFGNTALHVACDGGIEVDSVKMMEELEGVIKSILSSRPGLLEKRNNEGYTPLLTAACFGRTSICNLLINQYLADSSAQDNEGNTALHFICKLDREKFSCATVQKELLSVIKILLQQVPGLLEKRNEDEETALLIAAQSGHLFIVAYLCRSGANIEARDRWGYTPILNSAYFDSGPVLKYLIDSNANPTVENDNGDNALHLACTDEKPSIVEILLKIPEYQLKKLISKPDASEKTPLAIAVDKENSKIVSQLLQSALLSPQNSDLDEMDLFLDPNGNRISKWLLKKFQEWDEKEETKGENDAEEHLFSEDCVGAVFCWTILNTNNEEGEKLGALIQKHFEVEFLNRGVSTGLHLVALAGNIQMLELIPGWKSEILVEAENKITPLHIAATRGHLEFLKKLLNVLEEGEDGSQAVLDAVLQETKGLDTSISLAASHGCREVEKWLWDKVFKITQEDGTFPSNSLLISTCSQQSQQTAPNSAQQDRNRQLVMGVAAWRYTTGERRYFQGFRNLIEGRPSNSNASDEISVLKFLVERNLPVALWWLLSGGDSFDEIHLKECEEVRKSLHAVKPGQQNRLPVPNDSKLVMELLEKPPRQRIPKEDKGRPTFQYKPPDKDTLIGTVLDVRIREDTPIIFGMKRADIVDIVYDVGPDKIMSSKDSQSLETIKASLFKTGSEQQQDNKSLNQEADKNKNKKETSTESSTFKKFRWIHIPTNNLQYVEDLMTRLWQGKSVNRSQTRRLLALLRKSHLEISSGEGTSYMRRHCQLDHSENMHLLTLYMPYIFWGSKRSRNLKVDTGTKRISETPPDLTEDTTHPPDQSVQSHDRDTIPRDLQTPGQGNTIQASQASQIPGQNNAVVTGPTTQQEQLHWPRDGQHSGKGIDHKPLTLDQYYYESLSDTFDRDSDQVLSRFFKREENRAKEATRIKTPSQSGKTDSSTSQENAKQPAEPEVRKVKTAQILMVNQLWLWILDDDTIITSTTEEDKKIPKTFLQRVLDNLHRTDLGNISQNDKRTSEINHIARLIMDTARDLFNARDIEVYESGGGKIAPLDAYRKAIQDMRELETRLFKSFRRSLDKKRDKSSKKYTETFYWASDLKKRLLENTKPTQEDHPLQPAQSEQAKNAQKSASDTTIMATGSKESPQAQEDGVDREKSSVPSQSSSRDPKQGQDPSEEQVGDEENPYQDISQETGLLEEIKDVLDELNILRTLAQEQDRVDDMWKQIRTKQKTSHAVTSSEISRETESMIGDARNVQEDINTLLDLKQKEASIIEAKATREQSDTVMTFTVVTIIFLPASFLTSLFALNVSDFPHQNGNVEFKGWWIFPIIFGVSFIVSAFFVVLAFNANDLKKSWQRYWDKKNEKADTGKQDAKQDGEGNRKENEKENEKQDEQQDEKPGLLQTLLGRFFGGRHTDSQKGSWQC